MELFDDASLLLRHARWPRAHALAVLALEELGKAGLSLGTLAYTEDQAEDFWKDLAHHSTKLLYAGAILTFFSEYQPSATATVVAQLETEARHEHVRKLRGLYVDLSTSGVIERPDDIDEDTARRVVDRVGRLLELLGPAWTSGSLLDRLDEIEAHGDELRAVLEQARQLVRLDPDAAIAIGRAGMSGDLPASTQRPKRCSP
jgi:AbiV family abortive infection protein